MATNSLHSIPHTHHHHSLLKHTPPPPPPPSFLSFLKPTTTIPTFSLSSTSPSPSSSTATFSLSSNTTTTASTSSFSSSAAAASSSSLDDLRGYLEAADFRQADEETRRLLIVLAGEAAQKRGYVFFSEVQFIAESDLRSIDELWRSYSDGRFGYSVQKRIFKKKANKDFTRFFLKVGWMKKLDTEVEQYNYRSFPGEFIWELSDDTPEGHLPLTNALRGTRLLNSILSHPAFQAEEESGEEEEEEEEEEDNSGGRIGGGLLKGLREGANNKPTSKTVLKPDYSF